MTHKIERTKKIGAGFFQNWPEPTDKERAAIRAEARKHRRPCECSEACRAGDHSRHRL